MSLAWERFRISVETEGLIHRQPAAARYAVEDTELHDGTLIARGDAILAA
ncbi:hypothetical protein [Streptomyces sp. NBC_00842]